MHRLSLLFLIQLLFIGVSAGQNSFDRQHEKMIRLHRDADPDVLLQIIQTEKRLIEKNGAKTSNQSRAKLALDRGIYFYMIDDYEKSILSFKRAEQLKGLTSNRDQILLYTYLGVSYRDGREDYQKSHLYLDKAIELAKKKKDPDLLAGAVSKKAASYYYVEEYAKGIQVLEPFIQQRAKELTIERQLSFYGHLGQGYDKLGNYSKSHHYWIKAIEAAKKTANDELISDQYFNYVTYFLNQQRYEEAKVPAFQAVDLLKNKPEVERKLYDTYSLLGQIYSSLNQPDSALYYVNLSHAYALKTQDKENLVISYATLGHIYSDQQQYAKSLGYLLKSAEIEEQLTGIGSPADLYHNIGVVYLKMRNYPHAIIYLNKSNKKAYSEGDIYTLHLNYHDLGESYLGLKNFERALIMKDSSFMYYDSIHNIESDKELLQQEVRYKTKFKEQENKLLKLEVKRQNSLREKEQEIRRGMLLLGLILIIVLLGIVYILFINNRLKKSKVAETNAQLRNQKLEEELLNQRLNLLTEEINRKNQLIQSLEEGANSVVEESLLNKVTLENDWLAFMTEFDKIHRGYLSELKNTFPELTTNNLRLAALVKMEFSNKEIANILCITENGVKKAKQRLKDRVRGENDPK